MTKVDVLIVGAGLAGLSAALKLERHGINFLLTERESKAGGLATTEEKDGFLFDKTGHWLHLRNPEVINLIDETAGLKNFETVVRKTHIYSHGVFTLYPFQSNLYGLPTEVQKECLKGFVQAWCRKQQGNLPEPQTFYDWVIQHMGEGIAKHFMVPYNKKLWTVHPKEMSPLWCQIYVPIPTLDEVIDGLLEAPERKIGYNATFIYPKQGGIEYLPRSLEAALNTKPILGVALERLNLGSKTAVLSNGETVRFNRVISSLPLKHLVTLIEDAPPQIYQTADKLTYQSVLYYNVALAKPPKVPGSHWIYVPEEHFVFYRAGFPSNAVSSVVPNGRGSAYVEISHRGELAEKDLWQDVLAGLLQIGIVETDSDVLFYQRRNIECAYVIFDQHHTTAVPLLLDWLKQNGVFSIGRYGKWTYNAMENAIEDGLAAATQLVNELKS